MSNSNDSNSSNNSNNINKHNNHSSIKSGNKPDNKQNRDVDNKLDSGFDISESSYKTSHTAVRKARRFALQGLYEWLMTERRFARDGQAYSQDQHNAPHDIAARTRATNAMHTVHLGYYHEMMREIPKQVDELEAHIAPHLDRSIDQIDTVEHAVLLIGAYELKNSLHIPYKVVIDESMKLNTHFGATDAHKLINAVMDKLAAELRTLEVDSDTEHKAKVSNKSASNKSTQTDNATDVADDSTSLDSNRSDSSRSNNEQVDTEQSDSDSQSEESSINDEQKRVPKPRIGLKKNQTQSDKVRLDKVRSEKPQPETVQPKKLEQVNQDKPQPELLQSELPDSTDEK